MDEFGRAQRTLSLELRALCQHAGADNAFVFDARGRIWCSASLTFGDDQERLYAQVAAILEPLDPPLHADGRLDSIHRDDDAPMYSVSFGGCYVLGLWMAPETNPFVMRRAVREALPRIEALTLALPPPGGSGSSRACALRSLLHEGALDRVFGGFVARALAETA